MCRQNILKFDLLFLLIIRFLNMPPNISHTRIVIDFQKDPFQTIAQKQYQWELKKNLKDVCKTFNNHPDHDNCRIEILKFIKPIPFDVGTVRESRLWRHENWDTIWSRIITIDWITNQFCAIAIESAGSPPFACIKYLRENGLNIECVHLSIGISLYGYIDNSDGYNYDFDIECIDWDDLSFIFPDNETRLITSDEVEEIIINHMFPELQDIGDDWDQDFIKHFAKHFAGPEIQQVMRMYNKWNEEHHNYFEMKNTILEKYEKDIESGKINEGEYLRLCNELRDQRGVYWIRRQYELATTDT
jgi:hypothetical protein